MHRGVPDRSHLVVARSDMRILSFEQLRQIAALLLQSQLLITIENIRHALTCHIIVHVAEASNTSIANRGAFDANVGEGFAVRVLARLQPAPNPSTS